MMSGNKGRVIWPALRAGVLILGVFLFLLAPTAVGEEILPGNPAITREHIQAQIRLMEYVLCVRFTTRQMNEFLDCVKAEGSAAGPELRNGLLQALELTQRLPTMDDDRKEAIRELLRADFEESAWESPEDPASKLFLRVMEDSQKHVAETAFLVVTQQALNAFIEYLEFCRGVAGRESSVTPEERDSVKRAIAAVFPQVSEDKKTALNGFDRTWHLIKVAWANEKSEKKESWQPLLQEAGASFTAPLEKAWLERVVSPQLWQDMASCAAVVGEEELGWTATQPVEVW
jgi:hypothetical protein